MNKVVFLKNLNTNHRMGHKRDLTIAWIDVPSSHRNEFLIRNIDQVSCNDSSSLVYISRKVYPLLCFFLHDTRQPITPILPDEKNMFIRLSRLVREYVISHTISCWIVLEILSQKLRLSREFVQQDLFFFLSQSYQLDEFRHQRNFLCRVFYLHLGIFSRILYCRRLHWRQSRKIKKISIAPSLCSVWGHYRVRCSTLIAEFFILRQKNRRTDIWSHWTRSPSIETWSLTETFLTSSNSDYWWRRSPEES